MIQIRPLRPQSTEMFTNLQKILPKHLLSRLIGMLAKSKNTAIKTIFINVFCWLYNIDLAEAERSHKKSYESFNDFFTRSLRAGARPMKGQLCSPADGTVAALGTINNNTLIQSKLHHYSVQELLAEETHEFKNGSFLTIYLAPHNYHRVHVPCRAKLQATSYVPGELFSVNQTTAEQLPNLFTRNERLICKFSTEYGAMIQVLVGAMLVAGIKPAWSDTICEPRLALRTVMHQHYQQGEEIAQFQMGSTVILLFDEPKHFVFEQGDTIKVGDSLTR